MCSSSKPIYLCSKYPILYTVTQFLLRSARQDSGHRKRPAGPRHVENHRRRPLLHTANCGGDRGERPLEQHLQPGADNPGEDPAQEGTRRN